MDFAERLSLDDAERSSLSALEHTHRYELAARLCEGLRVADVCCGTGYGSRMLADRASSVLGVDFDGASVDEARRTFGEGETLRFEQADALEFLERDLDQIDAIVIFEGLEHLENLDRVLAALATHERRGRRLIVSVPNDELFESENPYHVTQFGNERMRAAFRVFEDVRILYQFCAQGSVIRPEPANGRDTRFTLLNRGEAAAANNFIACVGFAGAAEVAASTARIDLEVEPENNRYLRSLYKANEELWRTNLRLGADRVGTTDSAAASGLRKLRALEEELESMRRSLSWRLTAPFRLPTKAARAVWRRIKPRVRALAMRILR